MPAVYVRHWLCWMSFVMTDMSLLVFWEHPTKCLSAMGGWSASHQNDPRHGHILLQGYPGCSKHRSQLSSRDQQVPVSAGLPWDGLSWITVRVHGHCGTCLVSSHKAAARGSKAEHQRHIYHYTADGKTYQVTGCPSFPLKYILTSTKSTPVKRKVGMNSSLTGWAGIWEMVSGGGFPRHFLNG